MPRLTITVYTKPRCPLCDEALEEIELARRTGNFAIEEINILSDPQLYERYKHDIPVITLEGEELFRIRLTADALLARLGQKLEPT